MGLEVREGTTYWYVVTAVLGDGSETGCSNEAEVHTYDGEPAPPYDPGEPGEPGGGDAGLPGGDEPGDDDPGSDLPDGCGPVDLTASLVGKSVRLDWEPPQSCGSLDLIGYYRRAFERGRDHGRRFRRERPARRLLRWRACSGLFGVAVLRRGRFGRRGPLLPRVRLRPLPDEEPLALAFR